jgi:elongation factor P
MLEYNEILPKKVILLDDEPYEVVDAHVFRKQQRKPVNQTKLRHLLTGRITEQAFHASDKVKEADLSTKPVTYLYNNRDKWWFCEPDNPRDRFELPEAVVGPQGQFLKPDSVIEALVFNEEIIGLKIPVKIDLLVKDAPPAVRGNTAQGGTKQVMLETGTTINAPLFVKEGDVVRVNTETASYVERIEKS